MLPILAAAAVLAAAPTAPAADAMQQIQAAMTASAAGWNAGDLDRFVAIYADDAVFVTPQGLLRDKAAIADHYRPSFAPGGNRRGTLSFRFLGSRRLSAAHQLLFARWTLTPPGGTPESGMTTLVFEHRPQGWRIISDHSS